MYSLWVYPSGNGYLHEGNYITMMNIFLNLERNRDSIRNFISITSEYFHSNIINEKTTIIRMSDFYIQSGIQYEKAGTDLLKILISNSKNIGESFLHKMHNGRSGVRCSCDSCKVG